MFFGFLSMKYACSMLRLFCLLSLLCSSKTDGLTDLIRKPNNTFAYPNNPQLFNYHSANLLPGISFTKPICIRATNANGGELFIAEQEGRVWRVTQLSTQPRKTLFLDLSARVHSKQESGFIGFELHPQFEKNGYFIHFTHSLLLLEGMTDYTIGYHSFNLKAKLEQWLISKLKKQCSLSSINTMIIMRVIFTLGQMDIFISA